MKTCIRILMLLLTAINIHAGKVLASGKHGKALIDSLVTELNSPKFKDRQDTVKSYLLERISFLHYSVNPDDGVKYGLIDLTLCKTINYSQGIAGAYNAIGVNYQYKSDYAKALQYFDSACILQQTLGNKKGLASTLSNIGYAYTLKGDFSKALDYDTQAVNMFIEVGAKEGMVNTLGNIGSLYMNTGEYAKALDYDFKALKINEEAGHKSYMASNMGTIGSVYTLMGENTKALDYYNKALALNQELGNTNAIAGNYANMGSVYSSIGDSAKALEYQFRALKIFEDIGNKTGISLVCGNIGDMYNHAHNYTQSIAFLFRALQIARESGDENSEAGQLRNIASCYLHLATDPARNENIIVSNEFYTRPYIPDTLIPRGRNVLLQKAYAYITAAIDLEKKVGDVYYLQGFYHDLASIDSLNGKYLDALAAYEQYIVYKDSVFNGANKIKITNLETKRELDLKDKQIEINKLAVEKKHNERIFYISGIMLLLMVIGVVMKNNREQKNSNILLLKEKKRSEDLLLNILPSEVADELKDKGTAAARQFDDVTVMFTDFVDFTKAGERMKPQELIDELHTCFKAFDEIISRHNIEKIKTIGDAYLAVSGLPASDPKHAENIARVAMDINEFMRYRLKVMGDKTFGMRIGIHSGSVVAGIVGVKKFAYDIWGDTVNTAARMEQNSESGKINISQTTYELIKDKFACTYRGEIEAKNKGSLKMYFLDGLL